jgi:hypothetical protein
MGPSFSLPFRQVHLDFHTAPQIPAIGSEFDASEFARVVKEAHVNSVTVFAKCHHGHLYYETDRPERHPGLSPDLDLTQAQVEALHAQGIRAPLYISLQVDEYAANLHPEWVARNPDTSQVKWANGVFGAGWQILDMSSPYQDYVAGQVAEILAKFRPVDGVFYDMCWDQPSVSKWAIAGMQSQELDPENENDRWLYARQVALAYMKRFYALTKESSPQATVYFNSRPLFNLTEDIQYLEQVEIEALPTGGWGYMYFPINVRYARTFPRPYLGMTARFHRSWGDFGGLKPYPALEYETSQMMAHGARCSIGDQLHPRGRLDRAAYELIGRVYQRVAARQPWLEGVTPLCEVGLFQRPTSILRTTQATSLSDEGATRMLTQLKTQFDVVQSTSDLGRYALLILPDGILLDQALIQRLQAYLKNGGRLLATGASGLSLDGSQLLIPELGLYPQGLSPFTTTYFRFEAGFEAGASPTDHVMYERGMRVLPATEAQVAARLVEPYFERAWDHFSSHRQTPPERVTPYAAALLHRNTGYISYPVFQAFAQHGNLPFRWLVQVLLDRLLPQPLLRMPGAPSGLEATLMRQGTGSAVRTILHLLYYPAERRARDLDIIEDIIPLYDLPLSLKLPVAPQSVYLAPERSPLDFDYADGRLSLILPEMRGHAMVVFE